MYRAVIIIVALAATLVAASARADEPGVRGAAEDAAAKNAMPDLHKMLMDEFDTMNASHEGIFRHDITPSLVTYFPVGQSMAETKKILAAQNLGTLAPFKGTNDPGMGTMYVSKFDLVGHVFSHVYVVLDFDFDGAEPDMKLKAMKAYLRASNM